MSFTSFLYQLQFYSVSNCDSLLSSLISPLVSSSGVVSGFEVSTSGLCVFSSPLSVVLLSEVFVWSPLLGGLIGGYLSTMAIGIKNKSTKKDMINGWIVLILYLAFLSYVVFFVK